MAVIPMLNIDERFNDLIAELDSDDSLRLEYDVKYLLMNYYLENAYSLGKEYADSELRKSNALSAERRDRIIQYQQRLHEASTNRKKKDVEKIASLTQELKVAKERIYQLENQLVPVSGGIPT